MLLKVLFLKGLLRSFPNWVLVIDLKLELEPQEIDWISSAQTSEQNAELINTLFGMSMCNLYDSYQSSCFSIYFKLIK